MLKSHSGEFPALICMFLISLYKVKAKTFQKPFIFSDAVLKWFEYYLKDRNYFCLSVITHLSKQMWHAELPRAPFVGLYCTCSHLLRLWETTKCVTIIMQTTLKSTTTSPGDYLVQYKHWISALNKSSCQNLPESARNKDKTEVIVFEIKEERLKANAQLQLIMLKISNKARNLGVMDLHLSFNSQLRQLQHLKNISRIKGLVSQQGLEKLIFSRHGYCNGVFTGLLKIDQIQKAAARVRTKTKKVDYITSVLTSFHWFPVCQRIDFLILLLVYKTLNGLNGPKIISAATLWTI